MTATPHLLVLGGTGEARDLAAELHADGAHVISSLAGRVARPRLPVGEVRIGGFGGPEGLAAWIDNHAIDAVVDATHPFAARISASATRAATSTGTPLLRLERPGWSEREQAGDRWHWVDTLEEAARELGAHGLGARVLLTTGRQGLPAFADTQDAWFLIRCVDPPEPPLPQHHELVLDRGPYTLESELQLIDDHAIDVVVTKDSGGPLTVAKLDAARARDLPVVIVRRPPRPDVETVRTVGEALAWVRGQSHPG